MLVEPTGNGQPSLERTLVALVRAVRTTEASAGRTPKHVYRAARRRRRKLGLMSVVTGPFAGPTIRVADLYGEAATVCDLADTHRLELSDEHVAAHLLVLWAIADDVETAHAAVSGRDGSVTKLLAARLGTKAGGALPERWTKRTVVTSLWQARSMAKDARSLTPSTAVSTAVRPGRGAKRFIQRAEQQLGVRGAR